MASLKDIRIRIVSVKSTRKITSAMKVVSAAKYHKAQEMQHHFQQYLARFEYALALAIARAQEQSHPLMRSCREEAPVALLALASNSSLCGAYNSNAAAHTLDTLKALSQEGKQVQLFSFGKRMSEALIREGVHLEHRDDTLVDRPTYEQAQTLYTELSQGFLEGTFSRVEIVYNKFQNAATQHPVREVLLPITPSLTLEAADRLEYIFEPTVEDFFARVLPQYGKLSLYSAFMNNYVGEHGARMTAMTQATDNANNLVDELTLQYNKARQAAITSEILEIVSGADALRGE